MGNLDIGVEKVNNSDAPLKRATVLSEKIHSNQQTSI